jgi:hypothetical protein
MCRDKRSGHFLQHCLIIFGSPEYKGCGALGSSCCFGGRGCRSGGRCGCCLCLCRGLGGRGSAACRKPRAIVVTSTAAVIFLNNFIVNVPPFSLFSSCVSVEFSKIFCPFSEV